MRSMQACWNSYYEMSLKGVVSLPILNMVYMIAPVSEWYMVIMFLLKPRRKRLQLKIFLNGATRAITLAFNFQTGPRTSSTKWEFGHSLLLCCCWLLLFLPTPCL